MSKPLDHEIEYPETAGRTVGDSEFHSRVFFETAWSFDLRFLHDTDVYVWGNMLLYYAEGDPEARVCPDLFLVLGVPKHPRRTFKLWEEGETPSLIIEFTSLSTREEDLGLKKDLYERLKVEEYFLFDPLGEYLKPRLQGYRLNRKGIYRLIEPEDDGSLISKTTGVSLTAETIHLRLRDADTGHPIPRPWEMVEITGAALAGLEELESQSMSALAKLDALEEDAQRIEARAQAAEDRLKQLDQEFAILSNEPVN